jgi:hypothetical protein
VLNVVEMLVVTLLGWWGVVQTGIPLGRLLDISLTPPAPTGAATGSAMNEEAVETPPSDVDSSR